MTILKKFFTPKWQHKDPVVRRKAIAKFESDQERLAFIEWEGDLSLQQFAAEQCHSDTLQQQLKHNNSALSHLFKSTLLKRLLKNEQLPDNASDDCLIQIASLTDDSDLRLSAISRLDNEQQCLSLATDHPVAKVRLVAAERISSKVYLKQLLDVSQGKDKSLYRLCKTKLNVLREQEIAIDKQQQQCKELIDQLTYWNERSDNKEFLARVTVLKQKWQAIHELAESTDTPPTVLPNKTLIDAFAAQVSIAEQHIVQRKELAAQQKAKEDALEAATQQQQEIAQHLQQLIDSAANDNLELPEDQIAQLQDQWQQINTLFDASQKNNEHTAQFNSLISLCDDIKRIKLVIAENQSDIERLQQLDLDALKTSDNNKTIRQLDQLLTILDWPESLSTPLWLDALLTIHTKLKATISATKSQLDQHQQTNEKKLIVALEEGQQAIAEGQAKRAGSRLKHIQTVNRSCSDKIQKKYQSQIQRLTAQLQELRDWQDFSTEPKRIELCEQMEALVENPVEPQRLADEIQLLQQQWKGLGGKSDQSLWQRFHEASDKAFEPCRQYFDQQAELRAQNLQQRLELISQLTDYEAGMNWQTPDWKLVQQTLNSARQTFQQLAPVERQAYKKTNDDFQHISQKIYQHLKDEYDKNSGTKQRIIDRATALLDSENIDEATNQVKQLQQDWKSVGILPRKQDQVLWQNFRSVCDQIYDRRNQQRDERRAAISDNVERAEQQLKQLQENIANAKPAEQNAMISEVEQQLASIELPTAASKKISKMIQQLRADVSNQANQQKQKQYQQQWQTVTDLIASLSLGQRFVLPENSAELNLPKEFSVDQLSDTHQQALLFSELIDANSSVIDQLRQLCVSLEICTGVDSPEASLRMEIQVKRLASGLGQQKDTTQQRRDIVLCWIAVHGQHTLALNHSEDSESEISQADSSMYAELSKRFISTLTQSLES